MSIDIESISLSRVRSLPPLPSWYETAEVYRLERLGGAATTSWRLQRTVLPAPVHTVYDDGVASEWLQTYAQEPGLDRLRFLTAVSGTRHVGLLTWAHAEWNDTVWLVDIRVDGAFRRLGVGSRLLAALVGVAPSLDVRGIHVETQIRNTPALNFYVRHGFEVSGFNQHLYSNTGLQDQDVALYLFRPLA